MFTGLKRINQTVRRIDFNNRFIRHFYDSYSKHDTIFAPATQTQSTKGAPLGVIRVSGRRSKDIVELLTGNRIVQNDSQTTATKVIKPRQVKLVKFKNPGNQEVIDQGLVLWFEAPHSYTGENTCEFHLHGSKSVMDNILRILGQQEGLRTAEPGEFTKRAYLNGKMSLIQAESVKDLIESRTDNQRRLAMSGLSDSVIGKYRAWSDILVKTLAHLEAAIDFGEDSYLDELEMTARCTEQLHQLIDDITSFIIISSRRRDAISDGFKVVILGKPNSGKSTLMNLLCGSDRSIVSSLSGTTRDIVEHPIELDGHLLTLSDTAGLKEFSLTESSFVDDKNHQLLEQHESIEKEGIKRALQEARKADLVLYMVDGSNFKDMDKESGLIVNQIRRLLEKSGIGTDIPVKLIVNKIDCNKQLETANPLETLKRHLSLSSLEIRPHLISCLTQKNVGLLLQDITEQLNKMSLLDNRDAPEDSLYYVNSRHLNLLEAALRHLEQASELEPSSAIDRLAQHLREALDYLSRISGDVSNERVIDVIFKDFCIGK